MAHFMNLPHGKYIFYVNASNEYGIWFDNATPLEINILPPILETVWFRPASIGPASADCSLCAATKP